MHSNPYRVAMRFSQFNRRAKRLKISGIWFTSQWCNCCTLNEGRHRHLEKRLSKQKTLRNHRQGVRKEVYV